MVKIFGNYTGNLHCEATHEPSGNTLETDAPKDNQGLGAAFSPTDLCATSLATCVVTTMAIQARTSTIPIEGMRYEVTKTMSSNPPRRIAKLDVHVWFEQPLEEDQKKRLMRAAATCPVHRSLSPELEMPITFHWDDGSQDSPDPNYPT